MLKVIPLAFDCGYGPAVTPLSLPGSIKIFNDAENCPPVIMKIGTYSQPIRECYNSRNPVHR